MSVLGIVVAWMVVPSAESGMWFQRDSSQFIFHAVLEGLYDDGVSNAVIDSIIPEKKPDGSGGFYHSFVYNCPLCHPAYEAMRIYRTRAEFMGQKHPRNVGGVDTFGKGLPKSLEDRLLSTDEKVRRPALQELIQRFVSRRIEKLRLTETERDELARGIEEGRKQGEEMLRAAQAGQGPASLSAKNWMTCVACDGSFVACPRPQTLSIQPVASPTAAGNRLPR